MPDNFWSNEYDVAHSYSGIDPDDFYADEEYEYGGSQGRHIAFDSEEWEELQAEYFALLDYEASLNAEPDEQ